MHTHQYATPLLCRPCTAPEVTYSKLIGYATPPTSYGGYGGNAEETPR